MGRRNRNSFLLSPEWILMLKWWIYLNHVCFQMKWHQWDPRNRGSTFKTVVDFLLESPGVRGRCPGRWWQRPRAASPVPQPWVFGLQEDPLTWSPWPRPHVYPQSILRALAWLTCTFSAPPQGFLHWCSPTHPHGFFLVWQDIKMFCLKRTSGRSHINSPLVLRGLVQTPVANRYPLTLNLALPF